MSLDSNYDPTSLPDVPLERRPKHIAVIMDGNGRWARLRELPRIEGHRQGVEAVRRTMEACQGLGIQALTLYCLSSENWKRPQEELDFLMHLLKAYLIAERSNLAGKNLKLRIIGRRDRMPQEVQLEMDRTLDACALNTGMTLCLAINYGSRGEIVDAVRAIAEKVAVQQLSLESIDENEFDRHLYTHGLPEVDLLVRTSGEMRISNFLLWQISYAELWVTDVNWPDFGREQLEMAIREFAVRQRRFGGL